MPTTVAINSLERVKQMFRNEFDKYNMPWQTESAKEVIQDAENFNLPKDFINELKADL